MMEIENENLIENDEMGDNLYRLYLMGSLTDLTLVVGGRPFDVHRVIIASRCSYFEERFPNLSEEPEGIVLYMDDNLDANAFETIIRYLYTGEADLNELTFDEILNVLHITKELSLHFFRDAIYEYLITLLTIDNVLRILEVAENNDKVQLKKFCVMLANASAQLLLEHQSFNTLSAARLKELLDTDNFYASEIEIFKGVCRWANANPNINHLEVMEKIRFDLISEEDMRNVVEPSNVLPQEVLEQIHARRRYDIRRSSFRSLIIPNVDVIHSDMGAILTAGNADICMTQENGFNQRIPFMWHVISNDAQDNIIMELNQHFTLNTLSIGIPDWLGQFHTILIETSVDFVSWQPIFLTSLDGRGVIETTFPDTTAKFIRVTGYNDSNDKFIVTELRSFYKDLDCGNIALQMMERFQNSNQ